ncbi:hypothetical protein AB1Y20_017833 [Prymnesium parvum]|uniref:Uncharacterized protein n=1 Tax=Prymnesium parvum TaxID=97485 RepID=A0AB34JP96_PRYPA
MAKVRAWRCLHLEEPPAAAALLPLLGAADNRRLTRLLLGRSAADARSHRLFVTFARAQRAAHCGALLGHGAWEPVTQGAGTSDFFRSCREEWRRQGYAIVVEHDEVREARRGSRTERRASEASEAEAASPSCGAAADALLEAVAIAASPRAVDGARRGKEARWTAEQAAHSLLLAANGGAGELLLRPCVPPWAWQGGAKAGSAGGARDDKVRTWCCDDVVAEGSLHERLRWLMACEASNHRSTRVLMAVDPRGRHRVAITFATAKRAAHLGWVGAGRWEPVTRGTGTADFFRESRGEWLREGCAVRLDVDEVRHSNKGKRKSAAGDEAEMPARRLQRTLDHCRAADAEQFLRLVQVVHQTAANFCVVDQLAVAASPA